MCNKTQIRTGLHTNSEQVQQTSDILQGQNQTSECLILTKKKELQVLLRTKLYEHRKLQTGLTRISTSAPTTARTQRGNEG